MSHLLRPGDTVVCCGGFGTDAPRAVKVKSIEAIAHPDDNEGTPVAEIPWDEIKGCRVELDDGPWAYGGQLTRVPDEAELVIGQCPYCAEINRHASQCARPMTRVEAAAEWNQLDAARRARDAARPPADPAAEFEQALDAYDRALRVGGKGNAARFRVYLMELYAAVAPRRIVVGSEDAMESPPQLAETAYELYQFVHSLYSAAMEDIVTKGGTIGEEDEDTRLILATMKQLVDKAEGRS